MKIKHVFIMFVSVFALMQCTPSNQAASNKTTPLPTTPTPTEEIILPTLTSAPTEEVILPTQTSMPQVIAPEINQELAVPQGNAPTIDGTFSEGEWDDALISALSDGSRLMFLHDREYLYLGIRSQRMGVASVCTKRGDQIWILHSSAALGNAIYEQNDAGWQMIEGFEWCCRDTVPNAEQAALLEEKDWTASIGYMGDPQETEFQIALESDTVTMAVAYYLSRNQIPFWPNWLEDDCPLYDVVEGSPPETVQFNTDSWVTLKADSTAVDDTIEGSSYGVEMVDVSGGK